MARPLAQSTKAILSLAGERLARFNATRRSWLQIIAQLAPLGGLSEGNAVVLYNSGSELFRDMWGAIHGAKKRVMFGTYTLEPDAIGRNTLSALAAAAKRGCEVTLLYDDVGSYRLSVQDVQPLRDAGVRVVAFNPVSAWLWPRRLSWRLRLDSIIVRNHRKLLICDDDACFVGGMNVGAEYAGSELGGTDYFRDAHVCVRGPAVRHLQAVFSESLREAALFVAGADADAAVSALEHPAAEAAPPAVPSLSQMLRESVAASVQRRMQRFARRIPTVRTLYNRLAANTLFIADDASHISHASDPGRPLQPLHDGVLVQVLSSNARRGRYNIQRALALSLRRAQRTCYIVTPYFLPPRFATQSLIRAAQAGVDVRILTAGMTDVPLYRMAAHHVYDEFLRNGVRIYELTTHAVHAKTAVFDSMYATVGSFNMDLLSTHRNLEVLVSFYDPLVAAHLQRRFLDDLDSAIEITRQNHERRSWLRRLCESVVYRVLGLVLRP